MKLQNEIFAAFSARSKPDRVLNCSECNAQSEDYEDALFFEGKSNREIKCKDFDHHPDCFFGFSPGAFLYYLPCLFACSIEEARPDLLTIHSIVSMLDRGNAPNTWDSFFAARWPLMTADECEAAQKWLIWLSGFKDISIGEESVSRAFDTLALIAQQSQAYPIAKFRALGEKNAGEGS